MSYCKKTPFPLRKGGVWAQDYSAFHVPHMWYYSKYEDINEILYHPSIYQGVGQRKFGGGGGLGGAPAPPSPPTVDHIIVCCYAMFIHVCLQEKQRVYVLKLKVNICSSSHLSPGIHTLKCVYTYMF